MAQLNLPLLNNPVVWLIVLLALFNYTVLLELLLKRAQTKNTQWQQHTQQWTGTLKITLAALPLLGLLGTIIGLLKVFKRMSVSSLNQQELLSSGIADAMFTTEMGLICVIPGLILHALLLGKLKKETAAK